MTGPPSPKRQRTEEPKAEEPTPEEIARIQKVMEDVEKVNGELEKEDEQQAKEIVAIEAKYNKAKQPAYAKRSKLLAQIPTFWKQVLSNHPLVGSIVLESDEKVLEHLTSLDVIFTDDNGSFKIELTFKENPFLASTSLWKDVKFTDDDEADVTASEIEWKESEEAKELSENCSFITWFVSTGEGQDFAELIKDDMWKNPMQFYLDADDDDEEEEEEEGEEGDDDEEEEEEGDDEADKE